jgi:hypothetical protein
MEQLRKKVETELFFSIISGGTFATSCLTHFCVVASTGFLSSSFFLKTKPGERSASDERLVKKKRWMDGLMSY